MRQAFVIFVGAISLITMSFNGKLMKTPLSSMFVRRIGRAKSVCILPKYDPWNAEIMQHLNLREEIKCETLFIKVTDLQNGKLIILSKEYSCEGRCLTRKNDYENIVGDWKGSNETFECDAVEARCWRGYESRERPSYAMAHTQIVKKSSPFPSKTKLYSVFIFLIDSLGASQAHRTLSKTMHYLENSMGSITFPFVNKVGLNSRPNGVPLWFGKSIEAVDRTPFGEPDIPEDIPWSRSCSEYLDDNYTSIFDDFRAAGYRTFLGDDWARGVLNWPQCKGFRRQPTDHLNQPFLIAIEDRNNTLLRTTYSKKNCIFVHKDTFNYLQQFIDAYKEEPKFSWIWTSTRSHDKESTPITIDTELLEFLIKNRDTLDKSFVFFMGDHGLRFGDVALTELGALDANNPMLTISVPKALRETGVVDALRKSAKSLQTHFDTRATLLDIAGFQYLSNFTEQAHMEIAEEHGQSFLREQIGERTCDTLPIPFSYCICDMPKEERDNTSDESFEYGRSVIDSVNEILLTTNLTDRCNLWLFSKVISISAYLPEEEFSAYSVVAGVSAPYSKAKFRVVVHKSKNGTLKVGQVDRLDSYRERGYCALGRIPHLCDCKRQH